jgi:hypothetical protein
MPEESVRALYAQHPALAAIAVPHGATAAAVAPAGAAAASAASPDGPAQHVAHPPVVQQHAAAGATGVAPLQAVAPLPLQHAAPPVASVAAPQQAALIGGFTHDGGPCLEVPAGYLGYLEGIVLHLPEDFVAALTSLGLDAAIAQHVVASGGVIVQAGGPAAVAVEPPAAPLPPLSSLNMLQQLGAAPGPAPVLAPPLAAPAVQPVIAPPTVTVPGGPSASLEPASVPVDDAAVAPPDVTAEAPTGDAAGAAVQRADGEWPAEAPVDTHLEVSAADAGQQVSQQASAPPQGERNAAAPDDRVQVQAAVSATVCTGGAHSGLESRPPDEPQLG